MGKAFRKEYLFQIGHPFILRDLLPDPAVGHIVLEGERPVAYDLSPLTHGNPIRKILCIKEFGAIT